MTTTEIWDLINAEHKQSRKDIPKLPDHIVSRAAMILPEYGKLIEACVQEKYSYENENKPPPISDIKRRAAQVAAIAIRFLQTID